MDTGSGESTTFGVYSCSALSCTGDGTGAITFQHTSEDHTTNTTPRRTLFTSSAGLENAKRLVTSYKTGKIQDMTPELWSAKKVIDSTIHPGTRNGNGEGDAERLMITKILASRSFYPSACQRSCCPTWLSQVACSHRASRYASCQAEAGCQS